MAVDRTIPPAPLDPAPFNIPQAFRTTLSNGLRVVIFDDERLPLVSLRLAFLSGDANDPHDLIGLTSAMTAMLTEGTENYSSKELAEKIERLGGSLHASSSDDFTVISGSALTMYSSEMLQMMSEIIFAPTFPEGELDLYKRNTIESLKFNRSQPGFLANEQVSRRLYGKHPYGIAAPAPSDIEKLTREALDRARLSTFLPNNAVFIAVGDVRKDELLLQIEEQFGDWNPGDRHSHSYAEIPKASGRSLTIVDRPGSAQSNIVIANLAIARNHPDYFPVLVMNQVLGAGASSRVFMNLREDKGYTYGAYTRFDVKRLAGDFEATAEVRTAVTGDSLEEFFFELNRIRTERVPDEELDDAKNFLTGVFPIRAETQEGLTNLIVNQELYGLPHDYLQTYREHVAAVTTEDVQRVANAYVRPDEAAIVIVGDAREILDQAREYADSIEIFDKEGHQKDIAEYAEDDTAEPASVGGEWELSLDFMGQNVSVTLVLDQQGSSLTGQLKTMLGDGEISSGSISGSRISATAATEMQGQNVEFIINGSVADNMIEGTISSPMIPDALAFTGKRAD
ncbi:MAG: pitrilysin family protein [Pyrinomonadaceae bacterium]|nr:pitrilysin family protein [Pyrinomonadaceae bacterium]